MCLHYFRSFFDDFGCVLWTWITPAVANDPCVFSWIPILFKDRLTMNCVNCGIATNRSNAIGSVLLEDQAVLSIIRGWTGLQTITNEHYVCSSCWSLANESVRAEHQEPVSSTTTVGHRSVCVHCGRSILRTRSHSLSTSTERESRIHNVICEWIMPNRVELTSRICHSCWVRADRASRHFISGPSTSGTSIAEGSSEISQEESRSESTGSVVPNTSNYVDKIVLPDYIRAVETESRCFIEGCQGQERNRVPLSTRKMMLHTYNYYIPQNNRLCDYHKANDSWQFLSGALDNYLNAFTALHIQDMLALKNPTEYIFIDFNNINDLNDELVHFWIGLNKDQFNSLFNEVSQFRNIPRGRTALGVYLMKLRTGDSNERIATMFQIPRSSLESLMGKARDILAEFFVPHHLGFNHINRQEIINKTLIIPKGLFGYYEGEERPVVIFDGTYCYVQKSSNYLYQKKTYSLHKYSNLVKPFLIVCPDGYIIDVLGPYPATTSDADILRCEMQKEDSELKDYFQPGDAFVLDRGFRDALPLLNECGFRTFVPGTLQQSESQLTTLDANKSRAVTICRWVVEVVNGRFKRDFKLFRQDYFNTASKHLMKDFEIAASLINRFHPLISDRSDAREILNIINEKMYIDNTLADVVQQNNLNRRRANFTRIDAQNNELTDFPQLSFSELILIPLGTYQIKQARSYYGEHIRTNGRFEIEVCREVNSDLLRELSTSDTSYIVRGRIQSRHISGKIYFIYILVDKSLRGKEAIKQYYCNCIVGRRTVGCCAHVMVVIWYLSWARYQDSITPPAPFLDDILIVYDFEDE